MKDLAALPLRSSNRLELDVNFEIWTVSIDKFASQSWQSFWWKSAFRPENLEQVLSCHARFNGLHFLQHWCQPSFMVLCAHGSGLADCVGRKEAEPPIAMIESNKTTKSRRIIVVLLLTDNGSV